MSCCSDSKQCSKDEMRLYLRVTHFCGLLRRLLSLWKPMTQKASKQASRPAEATQTTNHTPPEGNPRAKRAADPTASGRPRHRGNPKTTTPPQAHAKGFQQKKNFTKVQPPAIHSTHWCGSEPWRFHGPSTLPPKMQHRLSLPRLKCSTLSRQLVFATHARGHSGARVDDRSTGFG